MEQGAEPRIRMLSSQQGLRELSHRYVCVQTGFQYGCGDTSNTTSEGSGWALLSSPLCISVFQKSESKLRPSAGECDFIKALSLCCYSRKETGERHSCLHEAACTPLTLFPEHQLLTTGTQLIDPGGRREHSASLLQFAVRDSYQGWGEHIST